MTRDVIIRHAEMFDARGFVFVLEERNIAFTVLDQDNIFNPNKGSFNLIVEGMGKGEAILFVDGIFTGL
mgnify:CR=1 FL=1